MPATPPAETVGLEIRSARAGDLDALCQLENASFASDRLSRRRMRHWIAAGNRVFLLAWQDEQLLGYGLVLLHRGTRLARLYSLAVADAARGRGLGTQLLQRLEAASCERGRLYMRLEVAEGNRAALRLYEAGGYTTFGRLADYYDDHQPALRMQKRIRYVPENLKRLEVPWYQQTTAFTCGPASAMMAMAALSPELALNRALELDLWREATTIYMTSGHGGCHPVGLALAMKRRGFQTRVYLNQRTPLFVDGVRSADKKAVVTLVHEQFLAQARDQAIKLHYQDVSQQQIAGWISRGQLVLALISTYQLDRRKAPHWVTISAIDDECLYVHDPDPSEGLQIALDCQYMPISRSNFDRMSQFGRNPLRTFVVVSAR